jgi:hypothetical protein
MISYGYEDEVMLLATITPQADLKVGEDISIDAHAYWLVCQENCVKGDEKLSITLKTDVKTQATNEDEFAKWREQLPLKLEADARVLLWACTPLPDDGAETGLVIVFEDITALLNAQRSAAWGEVARRLAHEIKNPLTPIQLSAQRLRKRYAKELGGSVLDECTRTIIAEVEVLKNLVSEFAHFARLPAGPHVATDLNALIDEALVLFREAHRGVRFTFDKDQTLPLLDLDRVDTLDGEDASLLAIDERAEDEARVRAWPAHPLHRALSEERAVRAVPDDGEAVRHESGYSRKPGWFPTRNRHDGGRVASKSGQHGLIIASNRLPVRLTMDGGKVQVQRSVGGLSETEHTAVAVAPVLPPGPAVVITCTAAPRRLMASRNSAQASRSKLSGLRSQLYFVPTRRSSPLVTSEVCLPSA